MTRRFQLRVGFLLTLSLAACAAQNSPSPQIQPPPPQWHVFERPLREAFGIAGPIPDAPGSDKKRSTQLALAREMGLSHYRHELLWSRIESTPGVFDFSGYDAGISEAAAQGQSMVGIIAYGNPLYSAAGREHGDDVHYPPDDPESMRPYANALAAHYKGTIDRWEFWNEPNGGFRFWKSKPGGDPVAYAALAVVAATGMRKANPGIKLALGGLSYHEYILIPGAPRFLQAVLEARPELAELYDAVSYHPYKLYPPVNPPELAGSWEEDQDTTLEAMRAVMDRYGMHDREIWITENGWPIGSLVNEEQQAQYLVRSTLQAFAGGVREYDWYTFWDDADPSGALVAPEAYFGLVTPGDYAEPLDYDMAGPNPPRLKPGYHAAKTMLSEIGSAREVADVATVQAKTNGARMVALRGENLRTIVAWFTAVGGDLAVDVPRFDGALPKSMIGMQGESLPLPAEGEPLRLGQGPVYLRY